MQKRVSRRIFSRVRQTNYRRLPRSGLVRNEIEADCCSLCRVGRGRGRAVRVAHETIFEHGPLNWRKVAALGGKNTTREPVARTNNLPIKELSLLRVSAFTTRVVMTRADPRLTFARIFPRTNGEKVNI